jgi:thiopurine S-methyltransferase
MEPERWLRAWEEGRTRFHRGTVEPFLAAHWPALAVPAGARVLVPLCGKAYDLIWLAEQGYEVTGVELSPIACEAFFREHGITPEVTPQGAFTAWRGPRVTLLQGDIFHLDLPPFDAAYDRAATVALDPERRSRYAEVLRRHLLPGAPALLVTRVYPQDEASGPPFSVDPNEVQRLYGAAFHTTELTRHDLTDEEETRTVWKLSSLYEAAWQLRRRPATD